MARPSGNRAMPSFLGDSAMHSPRGADSDEEDGVGANRAMPRTL